MNYLAHGWLHVDRPYFLAGTAVPDWLNVVDRRVRARQKNAEPLVTHADPHVAAIAAGIVQHHHDDDWFHRTRAFAELSLGFAKTLREVLSDEDGMRPSFLGHILVELLLDAELIGHNMQHVDNYYAAMETVDPLIVQQTVAAISGKPVDNLVVMIPKFCEIRFLLDYPDDDRLRYRLNQVMRRVKLPEIPEAFNKILPEARRQVRSRMHELLSTWPDDRLAGLTAAADTLNI